MIDLPLKKRHRKLYLISNKKNSCFFFYFGNELNTIQGQHSNAQEKEFYYLVGWEKKNNIVLFLLIKHRGFYSFVRSFVVYSFSNSLLSSLYGLRSPSYRIVHFFFFLLLTAGSTTSFERLMLRTKSWKAASTLMRCFALDSKYEIYGKIKKIKIKW